jgi:hypothetical protein
MGKFREIARGSLNIDKVPVEFIDGTQDTVGLQLLVGAEDDRILTEARAAAIKRGVADPKEGNPIYDSWVARLTVLYSAVDPDAREEPYFESADQILANVDDDRVVYLAERQRAWQEQRSPRMRTMTRDQYAAAVFEIATAEAGAELPFWRWHPDLRESFLRTTCALLTNSPQLKSASSSGSAPSATSSSHPASEPS